MQTKTENLEITLLKTIGIIGVVMAHKYVLNVPFLNLDFYLIQIFIFCAGYFFNDVTFSNYFNFIKRKAKALLVPYFIYNGIYAVITIIIYSKLHILFGQLPTFYNFFITPFIHGHQYTLFLAAWFVPYLFLLHVIFPIIYGILIRTVKYQNIILILLFLTASMSISIVNKTQGISMETILLHKIIVGLFFYFLGYYYRARIDDKNIFNGKILIIFIGIESLFIVKFPTMSILYSGLIVKNFPNFGFLIMSMLELYLCLFIAKSLKAILKPNDIIYEIGRHSFHIMANHLLIFFIINMAIFIVRNIPQSKWGVLGQTIYGYNINATWPIYLFTGIFVPVIISKTIPYIEQKMRKNI